jgi:hypothetical protein
VIAGAGAAATSAVLGSFFGAMGTVTGAAVGSIASTVVTSVYEHSLNRTQDTVAARLRRRRAAADTAAAAGATAAAADVTTPMPRISTGPDGQPTTLLPPAGRPGDPATTLLGGDGPTRQVGDGPTRQVGGGDQTRRLGTGGGTSPIPPPKRPWGRWIGATVVVFVLGLLVVTGVELLKGSTLTRGQEGTSVGRVLERAPAEDTATPTEEPTATTEPTPAEETATTTTEPSATEESSTTAEPSAEPSAPRGVNPNLEPSSSAVPTTTTAEPDN